MASLRTTGTCSTLLVLLLSACHAPEADPEPKARPLDSPPADEGAGSTGAVSHTDSTSLAKRFDLRWRVPLRDRGVFRCTATYDWRFRQWLADGQGVDRGGYSWSAAFVDSRSGSWGEPSFRVERVYDRLEFQEDGATTTFPPVRVSLTGQASGWSGEECPGFLLSHLRDSAAGYRRQEWSNPAWALPAGPVAVGDSWAVDPARVGRRLALQPQQVLGGSAVRSTLVRAARSETGSLELTIVSEGQLLLDSWEPLAGRLRLEGPVRCSLRSETTQDGYGDTKFHARSQSHRVIFVGAGHPADRPERVEQFEVRLESCDTILSASSPPDLEETDPTPDPPPEGDPPR